MTLRPSAISWHNAAMTSFSFAHPTQFELIGRLLLATILGGLIGYEREASERPAGLRTHILVAVGAALFTLVSMHIGQVPGSDSTRIAAQIVSGIGFLGAGTIIHDTMGIRGLTTAASLWSVAGIGMACGAAYYTGAVAATGIIFATLTFLRRMGRK